VQPVVARKIRSIVPDRIEREILIDAPLEVVWAVITQPDHVSGWFSDVAEIDLRAGGKLTLTWEGDDTEHGRVVKVDPPHYFSFRWIRGSATEVRGGNSTLVEFSLSAEGEGTRLRVVETGFSNLDLREDDQAKDAEEHREGWERELDELREYLRLLEAAPDRP
jgi:uncharacterized protein YndB with AHSA1/START domain